MQSNAHLTFFKSHQDLMQNQAGEISIPEIEEKFAERRHVQKFNWRVTHPNVKLQALAEEHKKDGKQLDHRDIGIVFLGNELGYALVATAPISKNSWISFSGKITSGSEMGSDPEYVFLYRRDNLDIINEREMGGFASLLMDLPNEQQTKSFAKKFPTIDLASKNFIRFTIHYGGIHYGVGAQAMRDIAPGEFLGINYGLYLRLKYNLKGFYKNGMLLEEKYNIKLNYIFHKALLYQDKDEYEHALAAYRIYKRLQKNKSSSALKVLLNEKFRHLSCYLNTNELNQLLDELKNSTIVSKDLKEKMQYALQVELKCRKSQEVDPNKRAALELLVHTYHAQVAYKENSKIHVSCIFSPIFSCHSFHLVYPGIQKDYEKIAELEGKTSPLYGALLQRSNFFASIIRENPTLYAEEEDKVENQGLTI